MKKLIEAFKASGMEARDVAEEADLPLNILTRVFNGKGKLNKGNQELVMGILERAIEESSTSQKEVTVSPPELKVPKIAKGNQSPVKKEAPPVPFTKSIFTMQGRNTPPVLNEAGGYYEIKGISFIDSSDNKTTTGVTLFDYEMVRINTGIKKIACPLMTIAVDELVLDGIRLHPKLILIGETYHLIMYCHGGEILRIHKDDTVAYAYPLE